MTGHGLNSLLTVEEMARADAMAITAGVSGEELMEVAGKAVADAALQSGFERIAVLCGPGNNGGDGFVAARYLTESGKQVRLGLLGAIDSLKGDARINADKWQGETEALSPDILEGADCVIDAIFGAGLTRDVESIVRETIEAIGDRFCIAVDVPSGVHGNTGEIMGAAHKANKTVTFFRLKPGHLLFPGRAYCGDVQLVDIGIPEVVLNEISPTQWRNAPDVWETGFPWPEFNDHKYSRGHAVVVGGAEMTGAARLAVQSAMRAGAGIVTVAVPTEAATIYKLSLPGAIVRAVRDTGTFREIIEDQRVSVCLIGPGNGVNVATREKTLAILRQRLPVVLDADALSVFEETRDLLLSNIQSPCLMTPHKGEFDRLFDIDGDKVTRVREAARLSGATVLLKGADTVLAAPDGRVVMNDNAPADLATAGAGDVLAGMATGLMARGLGPFEAGCIAVWLHGEAAKAVGPGLIAEDLPDALPGVLKSLKGKERK
jgi:ADP-dependent NAD(P)H-hydrate dehydratase / NAD(P)H-hydrate epimerase